MNEIKLKSCPFCGGKVNILVCDDEGNIHDAKYEQAPWSGLGYRLSHEVADVPEGQKCPIAGFEDEGELGTYIYDTREDAAEAWNERNMKHGKWVYYECVCSYDGLKSGFSCSECNGFVDEEIFDMDEFNKDFCGRCGVKMDIEKMYLIEAGTATKLNTIGEAIKAVRVKRGLTQKALGLKLGFPENAASVRIAQYESNVRAPRPSMVEKIESILCCRFNKVQYIECSIEE